MKTIITVKMVPHSGSELFTTFRKEVESCMETYNEMHRDGVFGTPDLVEMRYLIDGGEEINEFVEGPADDPVSNVPMGKAARKPKPKG